MQILREAGRMQRDPLARTVDLGGGTGGWNTVGAAVCLHMERALGFLTAQKSLIPFTAYVFPHEVPSSMADTYRTPSES